MKDLTTEIIALKLELKDTEDYINKYATAYAKKNGIVAQKKEKLEKIRKKLELLISAQTLLDAAYTIEI